jgi:hypothetical protein
MRWGDRREPHVEIHLGRDGVRRIEAKVTG